MKLFLKIALPIFLLTLLLGLYAYSKIEPASKKKITIATGHKTGVYYHYAQLYKERLEEEGIAVDIVQTAGSIETLKLLHEKKVDVGFVQGGTATPFDKKSLKSVCSLYVEPLWLFYRASLHKIEYIKDLNQSRLSIGEVGSGTMAMSQQLLAQSTYDIDSPNLLHLNTKASYEAFKEGKIDAFFTVLSAQSTLVHSIMRDKSIRLAHLKRRDAFVAYFPFLRHYTIAEGGIDLKDNIPSSKVNLLATTATLITHSDVEDSLIRLLIIKVKEASPTPTLFPSTKDLEIPIHEASKNYLVNGESFLEQFFPYWVASNIDRLKFLLIPLLTLLLPLFKGFVPIYTWRSRAKIYRWYKDVDELSQDWERCSEKELSQIEQALENLIGEIKSTTNVPLSFKGEYYALQLHIDHIIERIKRKTF